MSSWVTFGKQSMSWAYSQEIEKINDTTKTHDCHHQSWGMLKRFRYSLSTKTWVVSGCLPFLNGSSPISQKISCLSKKQVRQSMFVTVLCVIYCMLWIIIFI